MFDNLAFPLRAQGVARGQVQTRVERTAKLLALESLLRRKPRALSGGQRQRVAMGGAIVREPQVFLMDEPLSNLDAKLRVQTRAEILRLHQRIQTTFVYVTHDQVEAMTMGDRIAVLNAGIIQQLGTPSELYDTPANLFVAGFIGSPAMNFFTGRLTREGDQATVTVGQGAEAQTLVLAGRAAERVLGQATAGGREVVLGIRPEDLSAAAGDGGSGPSAGQTLVGTVDVVEHLGNEQLVHLQIAGALVPEGSETRGVTARLGPSVPVRAGDRITLRVDTAKAHVFDPTTTTAFV